MPANMEFGIQFSNTTNGTPRNTDDPFRVLVLADLRGCGHKDTSTTIPVPVQVDIDNFDSVMKRFTPRLDIPLSTDSDATISVEFTNLDHFHPDYLYQNLDLFQQLKNLRDRLSNPASFAEAAQQLRSDKQQAAENTPAKAEKTAAGNSEDNMFERLLGASSSIDSQTSSDVIKKARGGINNFITDVVSEYIVPEADPDQDKYIAGIDDAISAQMRALLHHPAFQALESTWRSIYQLITELQTGDELKVYILDQTRADLVKDILGSTDNLQQSITYQRIVETQVSVLGGQPWAALVADYSFSEHNDDLTVLAAMGAIASQAGGPFLAAANPSIIGCDTINNNTDPHKWTPPDNANWMTLRQSSYASWIGLSLPRVILRQPYGPKSDQIDSFDFIEVHDACEHESFLWGNSAYCLAILLGKAFEDYSWSMQPGQYPDIEDLPHFTYTEHGEPCMLATAEAYLSDRAGDSILSYGLMPVLSYRNRNMARVLRFQSIAEPASNLSGQWRA